MMVHYQYIIIQCIVVEQTVRFVCRGEQQVWYWHKRILATILFHSLNSVQLSLRASNSLYQVDRNVIDQTIHNWFRNFCSKNHSHSCKVHHSGRWRYFKQSIVLQKTCRMKDQIISKDAENIKRQIQIDIQQNNMKTQLHFDGIMMKA